MTGLSFRAPTAADAALILAWRRSPEVTGNSFTDVEDDLGKQLAWLESCNARDDYLHRLILLDGEPVGYTSIAVSEPAWGVGTVGSYLGERRARAGLGAFYFAPLLNHCFYTLGLRKVVNRIFAENERVIRGHTLTGYRHVGVLRAHALKHGVARDVHLVEMLAEEWAETRRRFAIATDLDGKEWPLDLPPPNRAGSQDNASR